MDFTIDQTGIPDVLMITHGRAGDARGFFAEIFRENAFLAAGLPRFVQDNHARSAKNVLRGLHYQVRPAAIGKLVRCLRGRIFDVAVDIRRRSPAYGQWVGFELSGEDNRLVYIPEGFAHAYLALEEGTEVFYKTTGYYSPPHDRAIRWNDPAIGIAWPVSDPMLSAKDAAAPLLGEAENNFD
jgi:dTDP-4-dehydrorhamnose 3,5-epimerase